MLNALDRLRDSARREWKKEVEAAIQSARFELSPGIEWIPPPEYHYVFRCHKCRCNYASYMDVVSLHPLKRIARCGFCGHEQLVFD